ARIAFGIQARIAFGVQAYSLWHFYMVGEILIWQISFMITSHPVSGVTRTRAGTTPSSKETPREIGRPPLTRGRRPAIGTGTNAVPVTPVVTETTGSRGPRLSDEEWDIIRQFRARRADAYAHDAEDQEEEFEDEIERDEIRHPHVPRGAPPALAPAVVTRVEEEFRG
ncbi:hypothetical protein Dimus_001678, partial [Dionaea muscipula]